MRVVQRAVSLALVAAVVLLAAGCGSSGGGATTSGGGGSSGTVSTSTAPGTSSGAGTQVASALTEIYAAETGAVATYHNVIRTIGSVRPFVNIVAGEQQHVQTITALMSAHGVTVPAAASGVASPGTRSLACALGVRTEQAVIALYDKDLPRVVAYPDLTRAFQNLRAASAESHLPAFQHCS